MINPADSVTDLMFILNKLGFVPQPSLLVLAEGELISRELGLILRPQGDLLRLVNFYTGQILATSHESVQRANLAEAKIIELQQELERLRRKKN